LIPLPPLLAIGRLRLQPATLMRPAGTDMWLGLPARETTRESSALVRQEEEAA
jgi:hypothetical protein